MPRLRVLSNPTHHDSADDSTPAWVEDLRRVVRGEVRASKHDRLLYSTDASIYQVEPLAVVTPLDVADVEALMRFASERKLPILPRGGGTSLAGQCTNRAIVCDLSPFGRAVESIDAENRSCVAQPGIGVDELNRLLVARGHDLFFAPDPATSAHCAIGGCIGNNAAGSRSIRYGRTSENLAGVEVVLPGGERCWLEPGAGRRSDVALRLARGVAGVVRANADQIRTRFPKTIRRNAGYGLDLILNQLDAGVADEDLDLSGLICGSEGTLAVVTRARLKLHPILRAKGLAIVAFDSLEAAIDAVAPILETKPTAVELLDDVVLDAARGNAETRRYLDRIPLVNGEPPRAVLYVEYQTASDSAEIDASFARLREVHADGAFYTDPRAMADLWALRKAGEPLLHGIGGDRKPQTFVEDNAVPVAQLARFVREFKAIVARHGMTAAYYAHASVGVLHVRPMVNLHDPNDRVALRSIAVEVADLARDCGGVMSGEHGDGRIRGPLLERFFGRELIDAFAAVKKVFDPDRLMNPTMIVGAGPIESITDNLRVDRVSEAVDAIDTYFDYGDQHGLRGAIEQCNGAGVCRKTAGGTMCPSYRATLDERHSTRGRGNALRAAMAGKGVGGGRWAVGSEAYAFPAHRPLPTAHLNDPDTLETLDLCLSCKACKSECPSNVDVSRLKAEYLAQSYRASGRVPLRARVFGHVRTLNRLGAIAPGVANAVARFAPVRAVMNRVLKLAPKRSLPRFERSLEYPSLTLPARSPYVVLYADCFTTFNETRVGRAAIGVLEAFGYTVRFPKVDCCGRAMISTGLLDAARASIDRSLAVLAPFADDPNCAAIVACEPSCVSAIVDDWLQLKLATPIDVRERVARKTFAIESFLERRWSDHPRRPDVKRDDGELLLHGHCHQKALWGEGDALALLRRFRPNARAIASGCCGMAGSFGFDAAKYDVSMKIGELSLFPPIRATPAATVCAPGTSCRHQIHDGTGREAIHPIEVVEELIE